MANRFEWLQFIVLLLPVINALIESIESVFGNASGAEKKEAAMEMARVYLPLGPGGKAIPESTLSKVIDNQVSVLNRAGAMVHKGASREEPALSPLYTA